MIQNRARPERGYAAARCVGALLLIGLAPPTACPSAVFAQELTLSPIVVEDEARRVAMIERVSPSVVCVFDENLRGGGSGVLIDPDGYGLTNYHVVAGLLKDRKGWGGLGDGVRYELEVLGIDVTGDVAMFRLIPPKPEFRFPFARLGDSDKLHLGDPVISMGNPFMLSEDYSPSVALGMVTGLHRYQEGVRGNLTYTDCIQTDAPVNPGNSGGPLFNADGEVVGINGRISVNTRGRFNVGFGYAIASNQIKRFIPALRAGLLARHGTWQARVDRDAQARIVFSEVRESGPAYKAGIRMGDRLLSLDGTPIKTPNQVVSLLGTYPENWPVVLKIARHGTARDVLVRFEPVQPRMRTKFKVRPDINRRQVERVLRGFRRAVLGDETARSPSRWRWTIVRTRPKTPDPSRNLSRPSTPDPNRDGLPVTPDVKGEEADERYEAVLEGDGPVRMQRRYTDDPEPRASARANQRTSEGPIIEYDDRSATRRSTAGAEAYDLPPTRRMTLAALYVMQHTLVRPINDLDLSAVSHVGGDLLIPEPRASARANGRARLLEVLSWRLPIGATARFAFDAETLALARILVKDDLSGATVEILPGNARDIGGLVWPCTLDVQGDADTYRDTLSDWEVSP